MSGRLPWMVVKAKTSKDFQKIMLMKKNLKKEDFKLPSIPNQVFDILNYTKKLKINEKPDYLKIKYKLLEALKENGSENDFIFDWCKENRRKSQKKISTKYI